LTLVVTTEPHCRLGGGAGAAPAVAVAVAVAAAARAAVALEAVAVAGATRASSPMAGPVASVVQVVLAASVVPVDPAALVAREERAAEHSRSSR